MPRVRPPLAVVVFALLLLFGARPTEALTDAIATGNGTCRVFGNTQQDSFLSVANINSQMCDNVLQSGSRFAQAIANVNVVFAAEPIVDVQGSAAQTNGVSAQVLAAASGLLEYEIQLNALTAPPFPSALVPVRLRSPYAMNVFGTPSSSGVATLRVEQPSTGLFFSQMRQLGVDPAGGEIVYQGPVGVGVAVEIAIEATCSAAPPDDGIAGCQVLIDPILELDQAAFDALHGASSFVLEDFYAFELSPNLAVPEPGSTALLVGGLAAWGAARRRRLR